MSKKRYNMRRNEDELFRAAVLDAARKDGLALLEEDMKTQSDPISEEARYRFQQMLDEKTRIKKHPHRAHVFSKKARWISIAAAAIAVLFLLPMTTEAGRNRVTELITKLFPRYAESSLLDSDKTPVSEFIQYAPEYVPQGFTLVSETDDEIVERVYANEEGQYFAFTVANPTAVIQVDAENGKSEKIIISGEEGILVETEMISIIWSTDKAIFTLNGNLEKEEMLKIASSVKIY